MFGIFFYGYDRYGDCVIRTNPTHNVLGQLKKQTGATRGVRNFYIRNWNGIDHAVVYFAGKLNKTDKRISDSISMTMVFTVRQKLTVIVTSCF